MKLYTLDLQENDKGRDFIVADIHGCFELFEKALAAVDFDPEKDRIFAIGDLTNRGPQSNGFMHYLRQPWFHAIRGNHENIFCYVVTREGHIDLSREMKDMPSFLAWIREETKETLAEMRKALLELPAIIEIAHKDGTRTGLVHADIPPELDWQRFREAIEAQNKTVHRAATFSHKRFDTGDDSGVPGIDRVFFGHSPTAGPRKLGNCYFIDTGAVFRVMKQSEQDFYLSIIDLKASDEEILHPQGDGLVRTAVAGAKNPSKSGEIQPPKP